MISAQMQVKTRVEELLRQVERMGLSGKRLTSSEIVALYQSCLMSQEAARLGAVKETMLDATGKLMITPGSDANRGNTKALTQYTIPEQEQMIANLLESQKGFAGEGTGAKETFVTLLSLGSTACICPKAGHA